jgi:hypothetical protein
VIRRVAAAAAAVALAAGFGPVARAQAADEEALFELLERHMSVAGLRLEEATLEMAARRLGQVDRKDWLPGTKAPYVCYAGPAGARLGLGFGSGEGLVVLRRFELAASGAPLEYVPGRSIPEADRPTCRPVKSPLEATGGGLRLGMTKAEVIASLGLDGGGSTGDAWTYAATRTLELTPAQRDILVAAGVTPTDFVVERELRLEFRKDRLVAIRARQTTRG